eukprot:jgi/Chlat1/950/Chrsp108S00042
MGFKGVPGHEFVGLALDGPLAGRRVVGEINAGCGDVEGCGHCRDGDARHCAGRTVLGIMGRNGAFAEQLSLPTSNLLPLPGSISTDAAVFVEPLAAAMGMAEAVEVDERTRVMVAGDGRLGVLCAWAMSMRGAKVTLAGRHPERANLLPEGCTHLTGLLEEHSAKITSTTANMTSTTVLDGANLTGQFDVAVEATGSADVLARVAALVRPRGTIVLKTTSERPTTIDLAPIVVNELRLIGSRCGRFPPALSALASRLVPVEKLIDTRFPLERAGEAIETAGRGGRMKVVIDVAEGGDDNSSK